MIRKKIPHEEIEEGLCGKTDPKAGSKAKEGAEINIFESTEKLPLRY